MTEEQKQFLFQLDVVLEGEQNHLNWPLMPENVRNIIQGQLGTCRKAIRQVLAGETDGVVIGDRMVDKSAVVPIQDALDLLASETITWTKTSEMPFLTKAIKAKYISLIEALKAQHKRYTELKEKGTRWIPKLNFLNDVKVLYEGIFEKEQ